MSALWPRKVEVLGVTGDYSSGKTIFLASITHPSKVRFYDLEKGISSYKDLFDLGLDVVDVPGELFKHYKTRSFTQKDIFTWWLHHIKQIKPGQFDVIAVDPIDKLEGGLTDFVKSNYQQYGFQTEEKFASTQGIFWSEVKTFWDQIIITLATKCQTFAFSTHLKKVWRHGKITDDVMPRGKSTLMELASLYLFLERDTTDKTRKAEHIDKPSATVLKHRLSQQVWDDETQTMISMPLLPPRIEVATPAEIRKYMLNPPDYRKLKPEEKPVEKILTEADKLELESRIAADHRAAMESQVDAANLELHKEKVRQAALDKLKSYSDTTSQEKDKYQTNSQSKNITKVSKSDISKLLTLAEDKGVINRVEKSLKQKLNIKEVTVQTLYENLTRNVFDSFMSGLNSVKG